MSVGRRVLLACATGLVGRAALDALLRDPAVDELRVIARRSVADLPADSRLRVRVSEFTHLDAHQDWFDVDQVLCALGTTMAQAGSQAAFRRVDFEYPLVIGRLSREAGASHYALVSAAGSDPHSRVFYCLVKGELEQALSLQDWPSLSIARPSLLIGQRADMRIGEAVASHFGWLAPPAWRPVEAGKVARALVRALRENAPGTRIIDNRELLGEA